MMTDPGMSHDQSVRWLHSEAPQDRFLPCVSPQMQALSASLARVAATEAPILIVGEIGSGKSTLARQLYEDSSRRDEPLLVVHAPTADQSTLEGLQAAATSTVLIEEVGDLNGAVQDALMHILAQHSGRGGMRLIATTSRDLGALVERRSLRADLVYRLDVVRLEIPPLRQRSEDVLFLAEHFLMVAARVFKRDVRALARDAAERLLEHHWPGNVRELHNCITESVLYSTHIHLRAADLRIRSTAGAPDPQAEFVAALSRLRAAHQANFYAHAQRLLFQWALQICGGNRVRAAAFLGIGRGALRAKLRRYTGAVE